LRFFIEYKKRNWPEWLAITEFTVNNKVYATTKVLLFMANYGRELRMRAMEFAKRIKGVQKKTGVILRKAQEEMKRQADRE